MMKKFLNRLVSKLLENIRETMVDISFLHEMGMSPLEADNFFGLSQPRYQEVHNMAGIARLKYGAEVTHSKYLLRD